MKVIIVDGRTHIARDRAPPLLACVKRDIRRIASEQRHRVGRRGSSVSHCEPRPAKQAQELSS